MLPLTPYEICVGTRLSVALCDKPDVFIRVLIIEKIIVFLSIGGNQNHVTKLNHSVFYDKI